MARITIIGSGPIGVSVALGLKRAQLKNTEIIGSGADPRALAQASKMGAMDKTIGSVRSAVDGAQVVILDTTLPHTRDIMEAVGHILPDGCVVTDTGRAKAQVMEWAERYLPPRVSYVGGHPIPKSPVTGLQDASDSLFHNADYCIIPAKSARPEAVETVVNMVEALGANPLFVDAKEYDSYAAAMAHLPLVISAALVTSTSNSGSWKEMYRMASPEFRELSRLAFNDPEDSHTASLASPEALVHWLDQMIAELYQYRNQIKDGSEKLLESFVKGWEIRARLDADALSDDVGPRIPTAGETMAGVMLGEHLMNRYRELTGKSRKSWEYYKKS